MPSRSSVLDAGDPLAQRADVEHAVRVQPHRAGVAELGELVAGGDHRLARDAVPEVRGAADDITLDERDLGTDRRGNGRRGVAGRSPTDDDEAHSHVGQRMRGHLIA